LLAQIRGETPEDAAPREEIFPLELVLRASVGVPRPPHSALRHS